MKKGDWIILFYILLVLMGSFLLFAFPAQDDSGRQAVILVNGEEYARYKLSSNFSEIIEIKTQFGYNKLEINGGRVRMLMASCEDQLDVKAGVIEHVNETLICLPNRLVVTIFGESPVDMVSY